MLGENEIVYGDGFLKDARKLPKEAVEKLVTLFEILIKDAFDPLLHTKLLGAPLNDKYSFRITRDWRVGFEFIGSHKIKLLIVDHRDKIYKRLKRFL